MAVAFQNLYKGSDSATFFPKLIQVAERLETSPDLLTAVMLMESGLNPQAQNTAFPFYVNGRLDGYATGLIQFIPSTARALGTTTAKIYAMTGTQQLDLVERYYAPYKGKLNTIYALYMVTFLPAHLKDIDNDKVVLGTGIGIAPTEIRRMNPGFDQIPHGNGDGVITVGEFKNFIRNKFKAYPEITGMDLAKKKVTCPHCGGSFRLP